METQMIQAIINVYNNTFRVKMRNFVGIIEPDIKKLENFCKERALQKTYLSPTDILFLTKLLLSATVLSDEGKKCLINLKQAFLSDLFQDIPKGYYYSDMYKLQKLIFEDGKDYPKQALKIIQAAMNLNRFYPTMPTRDEHSYGSEGKEMEKQDYRNIAQLERQLIIDFPHHADIISDSLISILKNGKCVKGLENYLRTTLIVCDELKTQDKFSIHAKAFLCEEPRRASNMSIEKILKTISHQYNLEAKQIEIKHEEDNLEHKNEINAEEIVERENNHWAQETAHLDSLNTVRTIIANHALELNNEKTSTLLNNYSDELLEGIMILNDGDALNQDSLDVMSLIPERTAPKVATGIVHLKNNTLNISYVILSLTQNPERANIIAAGFVVAADMGSPLSESMRNDLCENAERTGLIIKGANRVFNKLGEYPTDCQYMLDYPQYAENIADAIIMRKSLGVDPVDWAKYSNSFFIKMRDDDVSPLPAVNCLNFASDIVELFAKIRVSRDSFEEGHDPYTYQSTPGKSLFMDIQIYSNVKIWEIVASHKELDKKLKTAEMREELALIIASQAYTLFKNIREGTGPIRYVVPAVQVFTSLSNANYLNAEMLDLVRRFASEPGAQECIIRSHVLLYKAGIAISDEIKNIIFADKPNVQPNNNNQFQGVDWVTQYDKMLATSKAISLLAQANLLTEQNVILLGVMGREFGEGSLEMLTRQLNKKPYYDDNTKTLSITQANFDTVATVVVRERLINKIEGSFIDSLQAHRLRILKTFDDILKDFDTTPTNAIKFAQVVFALKYSIDLIKKVQMNTAEIVSISRIVASLKEMENYAILSTSLNIILDSKSENSLPIIADALDCYLGRPSQIREETSGALQIPDEQTKKILYDIGETFTDKKLGAVFFQKSYGDYVAMCEIDHAVYAEKIKKVSELPTAMAALVSDYLVGPRLFSNAPTSKESYILNYVSVLHQLSNFPIRKDFIIEGAKEFTDLRNNFKNFLANMPDDEGLGSKKFAIQLTKYFTPEKLKEVRGIISNISALLVRYPSLEDAHLKFAKILKVVSLATDKAKYAVSVAESESKKISPPSSSK